MRQQGNKASAYAFEGVLYSSGNQQRVCRGLQESKAGMYELMPPLPPEAVMAAV